MEILHELGLLEEFLKLPHDEVRQAEEDVIGIGFRHEHVKTKPVDISKI